MAIAQIPELKFLTHDMTCSFTQSFHAVKRKYFLQRLYIGLINKGKYYGAQASNLSVDSDTRLNYIVFGQLILRQIIGLKLLPPYLIFQSYDASNLVVDGLHPRFHRGAHSASQSLWLDFGVLLLGRRKNGERKKRKTGKK